MFWVLQPFLTPCLLTVESSLSNIPLVSAPLPWGLWCHSWTCLYSFLAVVQHLASKAHVYLVWVPAIDCVWIQEWFLLWSYLFWKIQIFFFSPGWHPLPVTELQWKVLFWLQFLILSIWPNFKVSHPEILFCQKLLAGNRMIKEEIHRSQRIGSSILRCNG